MLSDEYYIYLKMNREYLVLVPVYEENLKPSVYRVIQECPEDNWDKVFERYTLEDISDYLEYIEPYEKGMVLEGSISIAIAEDF